MESADEELRIHLIESTLLHPTDKMFTSIKS